MIKLLSYWEIVKNFYANKQEKIYAVIHNNPQPNNYDNSVPENNEAKFWPYGYPEPTQGLDLDLEEYEIAISANVPVYQNSVLECRFVSPPSGTFRINPQTIRISWGHQWVKATGLFDNYEILEGVNRIVFTNLSVNYQSATLVGIGNWWVENEAENLLDTEPQIKTGPLENIDKMRKQIMRSVDDAEPFTIGIDWAINPATTLEPYSLLYPSVFDEETGKSIYSIQSSQEGLALKTYLSDVNNNWLDKEWIDGDNGVNAITAIQVDEEGKFSLDQLNLQSKMYKMLNAIAVSDGSFRAWQLANYDHEGVRIITTPMYLGSLMGIQEHCQRQLL